MSKSLTIEQGTTRHGQERAALPLVRAVVRQDVAAGEFELVK